MLGEERNHFSLTARLASVPPLAETTTRTEPAEEQAATRTEVMLSPAAHILTRDTTALQFGLDATTAGIFQARASIIRLLSPILTACIRPTSVAVLRRRIAMTGLGFPKTDQLIDDLLNHGVLIPARQITLAVLGASPLANTVSKVLTEMGIIVRRPHQGDSDSRFISQLPWDIPVVTAGKLGSKRRLAQQLARWPDVIPVSLIDATGVIGPIRTGGVGPCVQCAELYRSSVDPLWRSMSVQMPLNPRRNPVVEYTVAARLGALLQPRYPAPGVVNKDLEPGTVIEVSPYKETVSEFIIASHPICPACWSAA